MKKLWLLLMAFAAVAHAGPPKKAKAAAQPPAPKVLVAIERGGCMGECPQYRVELYDDGRLVFEGMQFTPVQGPREEQRSREQVAAVIAHFQKADFEKWADTTQVAVRGAPKVRISFRENTLEYRRSPFTTTKTVVDFTDQLEVLLGIDTWVHRPEDKAPPDESTGKPIAFPR